MHQDAPVVPSSAVGMDASRQRIVGLDAIRFICAAVVICNHAGLLDDRLYDGPHTGVAKAFFAVYHVMFNGAAAVIIFFLVSGFCIHYPHRAKRPLHAGSFYIKRFIRIGLPAMVFVIVDRWVLHDRIPLHESIFWSVFCEITYYALYPMLLFCRRVSSWATLIAISAIGAAALIAAHPGAQRAGHFEYFAIGWSTWIVGLPVWLLGCWLAENYRRFRILAPAQMWAFRLAIFGLAMLAEFIKFHTHALVASNCIQLNCFAIPACLWLGCEIVYAMHHPPARALEWAGGWSYSLYLVHPLVGPMLAAFGFTFMNQGNALHLLYLLITLCVSYLFFLCIERPSHRLALAAAAAFAEPKKSPRLALQPQA